MLGQFALQCKMVNNKLGILFVAVHIATANTNNLLLKSEYCSYFIVCDAEKKSTCKDQLDFDISKMHYQFNDAVIDQFSNSILQPATEEQTWYHEMGCLNLVLFTESHNTVETMIKLITNTRRVVYFEIHTLSDELFSSFESQLPLKPNFDSSITLFLNSTRLKSQQYRSKELVDNWSTLDLGWTFAPMSVMDIGGYITGIYPDITRVIAKKLKLKLRFHSTSNFDETNMYLSQRKVDINIGALTFSHQAYMLGFDFSIALVDSNLYFATGLPGPKDNFYTFANPFSRQVWLALSVTMTLILVYFLSYNYLNEPRIPNFHVICMVIMELIHETMPDHYMSIRLSKWSGYIILFIWTFLASLLAHSYRSTLLANIVAVDYEKPIDTFQDLIDNNMYIALLKGTQIDLLMQYSSNPLVRQIYQITVEKNGFYEGMIIPKRFEQLAIDRHVALIATVFYIRGERHKYRLGSEYLPPFAYGGFYIMPKHPFRDQIETVLGEMQAAGIIQHILEKYIWLMEKAERDHGRTNIPKPWKKLEMREMLMTNFILLVLIAIAAIAFAFELLTNVDSKSKGEAARQKEERKLIKVSRINT